MCQTWMEDIFLLAKRIQESVQHAFCLRDVGELSFRNGCVDQNLDGTSREKRRQLLFDYVALFVGSNVKPIPMFQFASNEEKDVMDGFAI